MPERSFVTASGAKQYRYGFNGKENDNEVEGEGNQQDYGMRIYDPRLGKFLSVDPISKGYPMLTPYQFASNCPVAGVDLDGMEFLPVNSSIYLYKYLGSRSYMSLNTHQTISEHVYGVQTVYQNIPDALRNPNKQDLKFTKGGPVTINGRDYDPQKDGTIVYESGRYYNPGPAFYGSAAQDRPPSPTNSTQGLYSFDADNPNNKSTDANAAAAGKTRASITVIQEITGLVGNWTNQAIWKASIKEQTDRAAFYNATNMTNLQIAQNKIPISAFTSGQGKTDYINFLIDGTLPMGNTKVADLSLEQLEYNLTIFYVGASTISGAQNLGWKINYKSELNKTFEELNSAYKKAGGKTNFDDVTKFTKPKK